MRSSVDKTAQKCLDPEIKHWIVLNLEYIWSFKEFTWEISIKEEHTPTGPVTRRTFLSGASSFSESESFSYKLSSLSSSMHIVPLVRLLAACKHLSFHDANHSPRNLTASLFPQTWKNTHYRNEYTHYYISNQSNRTQMFSMGSKEKSITGYLYSFARLVFICPQATFSQMVQLIGHHTEYNKTFESIFTSKVSITSGIIE